MIDPEETAAHRGKRGVSMITSFAGKTAVLTGAGSGFGLEFARLAARQGMNLVLVDVQRDALDACADEMRSIGVRCKAHCLDVSRAESMDALAGDVLQHFGAPHLLFNNAGVSTGGLVWESTAKDWEWLLGVNVMGVIHGVRVFTPMMLAAAKADARYRGHIVNTASLAGLISPPLMGIYNLSKHAVVSLSETLFHDLALVTDQVSASVLCPGYVPTAISRSHRNRAGPSIEDGRQLTRSQQLRRTLSEQSTGAGKVSAAQVAQRVLDAAASGEFYIYTHPEDHGAVRLRCEDLLQGRNPSSPMPAEALRQLAAALKD